MDAHLRDLRYFVAVAEELHFTRAAERLFISQPALSRQIAKLERDLRVSLVERTRRSVTLTDAGRKLLDHARTILKDWDTARVAVNEAASSAESVLRVGIQTSIGRGIIPELQAALSKRRPGWTIQLNQVRWDDPSSGLRDRSSDVALCWLPLVNADDYRHIELATEQRLLAVHPTHPLAGREAITFDDMAEVPLVALPETTRTLRDFWLVASRRATDAPIATVAHSADEAMEAVANGLGAVLISEGNATIYQRPDIATIPVVDLDPSVLAIVWRHDDHRPIIRDIAEVADTISLDATTS